LEVILEISKWWWILLNVTVNSTLEQTAIPRIGSRGVDLLFL